MTASAGTSDRRRQGGVAGHRGVGHREGVAIEVSARIANLILRAVAAAGADAATLATDVGFDRAVLADPDAHIPLALETRLWDEAAARSGDAAFGLHAAHGLAPGAFDVLDYAVRTAATLHESLERLQRYNRVFHDAAVVRVTDRDDRTRVEHSLSLEGATQSRHAVEFTLASIIEIGGQLLGAPLVALDVELRHAAPASTAEHARVFGVEPRFGCDVNAIELDRALIERPLDTADPALFSVIQRHAEALLAARPAPSPTTVDRVRRLLAGALGEGQPTLKALAPKLKMSERSLQRRLADEGVTFDALLDELRRDLALRYLSDPRIAVAEVAYLLGYSEPSPFHRAFKRWTGATPSEVRRRAA